MLPEPQYQVVWSTGEITWEVNDVLMSGGILDYYESQQYLPRLEHGIFNYLVDNQLVPHGSN